MATAITFETKSCKTYSSLARLEKAVEGIEGRYIAAQNEEGRYYAIFIGNDMVHVVWKGHCVTN